MRSRAAALALLCAAAVSACSSGSSGSATEVVPDKATTAPAAAPGQVPPGFSPLSVSFLSPTSGYAMGKPDCASPQCTTLVHTTDGGRSWTTLTPPPADTEDIGSGGVTDVRFGSERDGFAFGGGLFATHDGSRTWQQVAVPGEVADLAVRDGRVYVVVNANCTPDGCEGPAVLLTGAATGGPLRQLPDIALFGHGLDSVVLAGRSVFALTGSEDAVPYLEASADGAVFGRRALPCGQGAIPALGASGPSSLLLVCSTDSDAGTARTAFVSSDAGAHWRQVGAPPQVDGTSVATTTGALFVTDTQDGVSASRDGGRTWKPSLAAGEGGATYVSFLDDAFGVALTMSGGAGPEPGGARLMLTRDGGGSWARVL